MKPFKKAFLIMLAALFLITPASVIAKDEDVTVKENQEYVGRVLLEDEKYPLSHYKIETNVGDGIFAAGDRALAALNNGFWSLNKSIATTAIYSIEQFMTFNLLSYVGEEVGTISESIYKSMSDLFAGAFIVIAGGIAAYMFFVNQNLAAAVKALIGVILILTVTFWFYSDTAKNIKWINETSADIEAHATSANVHFTSENLDNDKPTDPQESTAVLRNQLFNLMIKKPYLLLNYGTTKESEILKEDPSRIDDLLKVEPYGEKANEKRSEIVKNEVKKLGNMNMTTAYSGERLGQILLMILVTIMVAIPILAMAVTKFLLQLGVIVAVMFAAIPLTMALIPSLRPTAAKWGGWILSLVLHKAALTLIIGVAIGISTLIYEAAELSNGLQGYMFMAFIITLVNAAIFKFRGKILEVATLGAVESKNTAERVTQSAGYKVSGAASKGFDLAKRVTQGKASRQQDKSPHRESGNPEQTDNAGGLYVVPGGMKEERSSNRQQPTNTEGKENQNNKTASERHTSSNSGDKEGVKASPSRSHSATAGAKGEARKATPEQERQKSPQRKENQDPKRDQQSKQYQERKKAPVSAARKPDAQRASSSQSKQAETKAINEVAAAKEASISPQRQQKNIEASKSRKGASETHSINEAAKTKQNPNMKAKKSATKNNLSESRRMKAK